MTSGIATRIEPTREARARRLLAQDGYKLRKSRFRRRWDGNNWGGYMIVYADSNMIEAGERFDLSLEDVERFAEGAG